ncbi:hypothetical protein TRICI_001809 [Trichomonascus ciferrii]|uniref:Uncharacterized protein n=1 Tax=Trichomonascus ciferrii TaxID=44093 RepID=A0A642VCD0_9ASCO|nr:hypothetical protein TRICI_001809 [Trichomonascus ciferrii]
MMDRGTSDEPVPDSVINGESDGLEEPLNENYLCLKFSETGWKGKIEDAMSASEPGDGDFVIEFIECKGKFMDYIHWYFQRFVHRRHLLSADYKKHRCIAIVSCDEHESGVCQYDEEVPSDLQAIGPGVSGLCSSLGSADVILPGYTKQPDSSYKPRMSDILSAVNGREMTISSAMEYAVSIFVAQRILQPSNFAQT